MLRRRGFHDPRFKFLRATNKSCFLVAPGERMNLETLLSQRQTPILKRWLEGILETYPADARRFLGKQKDSFANPVGSTLSRAIESFYRELLGAGDPEKLAGALEALIRVRAVQGFSASGALGFLFLLKKIVREETSREIGNNRVSPEELLLLDSRLDQVALAGFDLYMRCREKVFEIRARESQNQVSGLLRRAGLVSEIPAWDASEREKDLT